MNSTTHYELRTCTGLVPHTENVETFDTLKAAKARRRDLKKTFLYVGLTEVVTTRRTLKLPAAK